MISSIEALNFRSLRFISQKMETFHVLVGPNASGKTTFLDVINFLHDIVSNDISYAFNVRGINNISDIFWNGEGNKFELAIEAIIPQNLQNENHDTLRYEIKVGLVNDEPGIIEERLFFKPTDEYTFHQHTLFPLIRHAPESILQGRARKGTKAILTKANGRDNFYSEGDRKKKGKGWFPSIQLGPKRSALASLYEDQAKLPASLWFKQLLIDGVQPFVLNSQQLRRPSPPHLRKGFRTDGSNLPWMIDQLQKDQNSFSNWIEHIRTALPDIETISTFERPEDKYRYLIIHYTNKYKVPSWLVSDGTLRLLALTIPAYLQDIEGIYLIEEPENGIHPIAVKTVTDSLQSIYGAQVLVATHSPVILGELRPEQVLCFAKTEEGGTDIIHGINHPKLREWRGTPGLDALFASGVLG